MNDGDAVRYLHRGNTVTVVFVRLRTRSRVPFVRSFARPARTQLRVRFARRRLIRRFGRHRHLSAHNPSVLWRSYIASLAGTKQDSARTSVGGGEEVRRCTGRREAVLADGKRTLRVLLDLASHFVEHVSHG